MYAYDDCFCHCKDTNSKAIHNTSILLLTWARIVFATAKILIRKQFTTSTPDASREDLLFLPLQRY